MLGFLVMMENKCYNIITSICIHTKSNLWKEWEAFEEPNREICDLDVWVENRRQYKYGFEILGEQPGNIVLNANESILCVNNNWTKAKLTVLDGEIVGKYRLLNALLLTHLSTKQSLEIHASLISKDDKSILFLGPSGIGKTTQAELWMNYRGAEIINGDRVFIKQSERGFLGCGSPWHGSSPYCLNKQVPLSALIVLKQSKQNTIRRLTGFEMVSSVMSSVFWPTWYREGYEAACETFDTLLNTVPVYELSCRPDEDAVKLTEETIFGK